MADFPENTPQITVRKIESRNLTVTADQSGMVFVNGFRASRPITAQGLIFVWAPRQLGLPPSARIEITREQAAAIEAHAQPYRQWMRDSAAKAREFDDRHNEGGEGFNPYR